LHIALDYQSYVERIGGKQADIFGIPISKIKPASILLDNEGGKGEAGETRVLFTDTRGKRWAVLSIYGDCEQKLFGYDGVDTVNGVPIDSWAHAIPASEVNDQGR